MAIVHIVTEDVDPPYAAVRIVKVFKGRFGKAAETWADKENNKSSFSPDYHVETWEVDNGSTR